MKWNSFGVSGAYSVVSYHECITTSSKHDRWDGTDIVTFYPNVTSESAGGLLRLARTRIAELWLTHNPVQKFKTRRETQTSTSASGDLKVWCTYAHTLSLSLSLSMSLPLLRLSRRSAFVPEIATENRQCGETKIWETDRDDDIALVYLHKIFQIKAISVKVIFKMSCLYASSCPNHKQHECIKRLFIIQNIIMEKVLTHITKPQAVHDVFSLSMLLQICIFHLWYSIFS